MYKTSKSQLGEETITFSRSLVWYRVFSSTDQAAIFDTHNALFESFLLG